MNNQRFLSILFSFLLVFTFLNPEYVSGFQVLKMPHQLENSEEKFPEADSSLYIPLESVRSIHPVKQILDSIANSGNYQYVRKSEYSPGPLDDLFSWLRENLYKPVADSTLLTILFYAMLVIGLVFLAIFSVRNDASWIFSWSGQQIRERSVSFGDGNTSAISLTELAEKAGTAGFFKEMIRFYFLHLLKTLDTHGLIRFYEYKTNSDYLREMSGLPVENDLRQIFYSTEFLLYSEKTVEKDTYYKLTSEIQVIVQHLEYGTKRNE